MEQERGLDQAITFHGYRHGDGIYGHNPYMIADISSRFLVNLPASELISFDRVFYHLQCASWFYHDYLRHQYNTQQLSTRNFCHMMFSQSDLLQPYLSQFDQLYTSFVDYMNNISVYGCIIWSTNLTHVLLIRGPTGYWSFPKGKMNQDELGIECARREIREETGVDMGPVLNKDTPHTTRRVYHRLLTMYIVHVDMDLFPICWTLIDKTEVTDIRWVPITEITGRRYPTVIPFL
jgi:8-oxo-dGTP pyrophosphatase MutT (NUDIX family)